MEQMKSGEKLLTQEHYHAQKTADYQAEQSDTYLDISAEERKEES